MTTYRRGDVVLVPFDFTDATGVKLRPAVIVSSKTYNESSPDVVLASITSNTQPISHVGDCPIDDWKRAGLLKPSIGQMKLATVESRVIRQKLGRLTARDFGRLEDGLRLALGFGGSVC